MGLGCHPDSLSCLLLCRPGTDDSLILPILHFRTAAHLIWGYCCYDFLLRRHRPPPATLEASLRLCQTWEMDGTQTARTQVPVPVSQPPVSVLPRVSLKKDSRYARAQNNGVALETAQSTTTTTPVRRADRHSLRPPRVHGGGLDGAAMSASKTPLKTKRPSQESAGSVYARSASGGRQFTVGNIGNGGRIYLRYV